MNVIRFECRKHMVSSLIWAMSLTLFGYICIQLFVTFTNDMKIFDLMLSAYSTKMLQAFGAQMSTIRTLSGFYSFCFMYVVAAASFQATYMGMHVIGKEFSGKSADFLFSKPISRIKLITYKLISVILCLILVNVIYSIGTFCSAVMTSLEFDSSMLWMINISMFLTQLLFCSFGFLLGCTLQKIKNPLAFTTAIVCSFFLLQMVVNLEPDGLLSYFSFLNYVSADSILQHQGYELSKLFLLLGLSITFIVSGSLLFQRRDLQAV